jgi:hypothetical protein
VVRRGCHDLPHPSQRVVSSPPVENLIPVPRIYLDPGHDGPVASHFPNPVRGHVLRSRASGRLRTHGGIVNRGLCPCRDHVRDHGHGHHDHDRVRVLVRGLCRGLCPYRHHGPCRGRGHDHGLCPFPFLCRGRGRGHDRVPFLYPGLVLACPCRALSRPHDGAPCACDSSSMLRLLKSRADAPTNRL